MTVELLKKTMNVRRNYSKYVAGLSHVSLKFNLRQNFSEPA